MPGVNDERPPSWERPVPTSDVIWQQIDRMWSDLKRDSAERTERAEAAAAKFEGTVWKAIEKLDQTKADKWVQTALTGAVTAVVMAVLMALLALVVVGKPGKGASGEPLAAASPP